MKILGIESSCDETAAAVVGLNDAASCRLYSNTVVSSLDLHAVYGGVVPEIAARSHIEAIVPVVAEALDTAGCNWDDIDAIAVTQGAGLGGSLLIGVLAARTLAITKRKPLYAVNHVEGHLYANFITAVGPHASLADYTLPASPPEFPILGLIVSGGHSQLVLFKNHFDYRLLGQTGDDAIGEAFDKVGKLLGLPYPGGLSVSQTALDGDPFAFRLPKAKMARKYDFSFSGLKTAVLRLAQQQIGEDFTFPSTGLAERLNDAQKADIAASFQRVAIETVVDKTRLACEEFQPASIIIGGGVASSQRLREALSEALSGSPSPAQPGQYSGQYLEHYPTQYYVQYPDRRLCTDNGAMIAALGCFKHSLGQAQANPLTLDIAPNLSM